MITFILLGFSAILFVAVAALVFATGRNRRSGKSGTGSRSSESVKTGRATGLD